MNDIQLAKVKELAQTLRRNGLAGSETEAMRMAESMTTTEDRVNKNFEEKKTSMVRNYDFEKAKQNGATTYGANPSKGIESHIRNAASAIGDPRTTEASTRVDQPRAVRETQSSEHQFTQQSTANTQSWEKEAATQEARANQHMQQAVGQQTAPVSPQSYGTNGAITNAINNVQNRFAQQNAQQINHELAAGVTLSEAASQENKLQHVEQEYHTEQARMPQEVIEHHTEQYFVPRHVETPVNPSSEHQEHTVFRQQAVQTSQNSSVVEQALPRPEQAPRTSYAAPVQQQSEPQYAVEQTRVAEAVEQKVAPQEEEFIVEKTQEMPTNPSPVRDTTKYAEASISLADVFNVNRKL